MKSEPMKKFYEVLKKNKKTKEEFCEEIGVPLESFKVMTVSTKKTPKWIKAFLYGNKLKK